MSEQYTFEQACKDISASADAHFAEGIDAWEAFIAAEFDWYKNAYACMIDKTLLDYYTYHAARQSQTKQMAATAESLNATDLWDAVEQMKSTKAVWTRPNRLRDLLASGRFDPILLGKVFGTDKLWLIPTNGALPESDDANHPQLGTAFTNCCAIMYPDGHPSEAYIATQGQNNEQLRRWTGLGWIATGEGTRNDWRKTGHALVIDMEPGRDLNPWIVLTSHYPNDGQPTADGDDTVYVPEEVDRDDDDQPGVLPSDKNRTPVAKLIANDPSIKGSIFRLFCPDFEFTVIRRGSGREYVRTGRGPGLAHVMCWYWDPEAKDEVCFTKEGEVYMRFNPETEEITYSERANQSFVGEVGLFGELANETAFVTLAKRQSISVSRSGLPTVSRRDISTTSDF